MSSETPDANKDLVKKEPENVSSTAASATNPTSSPAVGIIATTNSGLPVANSNPITTAVPTNATLIPKVLVVTNSVAAGKGDSTTLTTNPTLLVATSSANASTAVSNAPAASALTIASSASKPTVNSSPSSSASVSQLLNKTAETGATLPNTVINSPAPSAGQPASLSINNTSAPPQTTSTVTSNSTAQTNGETGSSENDKSSSVVVLNKQRLQELVAEIDSNEQLDEDVEDMLLTIADDFIDNLVSNACLVAKHRGSKNVEVKDVQLILEKNYNLYIPGFGSLPLNEEFKNAYKKSPATEAHKQRMALIKKTLKKF